MDRLRYRYRPPGWCPGGTQCTCCREGCDCGCIESCPAAKREQRLFQERVRRIVSTAKGEAGE
jgi:hypothetical protein